MIRRTFLGTALALAAALTFTTSANAQTDRGPELDASKDYFARMITNKGDIYLKLYDDKAPVTVKNFVNLAEGTGEFRDPKSGKWVKRPYFNGIQFHRVIPNFMIQGGDPTATGRGGPGYNFRDEFVPELNFTKPGILAMANSGPNTNGSQFFITDAATDWLNQKHSIFGEVLEGTDGINVVKSIANAPRDAGDRPTSPIVIERLIIAKLDTGASAASALEALKAAPETAPATEAAPAAPAKTDEAPAATPATAP
ncbi:peptidylprolyl isomerase [bacterium]|nr:peptidylprolyl isomerase [bacterium]